MASPPLHIALAKLAADSREKIAADVLSLTAVRDAASAAAQKGLNVVGINVGPANLAGTAAMRTLVESCKGMTFQWVENQDNRDGGRFWELRVIWPSITEKAEASSSKA